MKFKTTRLLSIFLPILILGLLLIFQVQAAFQGRLKDQMRHLQEDQKPEKTPPSILVMVEEAKLVNASYEYSAQLVELLNNYTWDRVYLGSSTGWVDNISLTVYEDPKFDFWFDEKTNSVCMKTKDVTVDVKIPKLIYDFDMELGSKDVTLIYFDFMADYYVDKALDIEVCYAFTTQNWMGDLLPAIQTSKLKINIDKQRTYGRFKNRRETNVSGSMLQVIMKAIRRDVDIFVEEYLNELLAVNLPENINNRIFGNSTNGFLNPLRNVTGLENLLINFQVNEPYYIENGKLHLHMNGTVSDRLAKPVIPAEPSVQIIDYDTVKNHSI